MVKIDEKRCEEGWKWVKVGENHSKGESLHCALLLDYVPPDEPQAHPLETPLELGDPNCPNSRKVQTAFPSHNAHHAQLENP